MMWGGVRGVLLCLLLSAVPGLGWGPGGGYGTRRRRPMRLRPFRYKQFFPKVPEDTLTASGRSEGKITRSSPRFNLLTPNYNPDIVFKDQKNTGAVRLLTQRCKYRLNTLAIIVMNQWPGIRLRVTKGWVEDGNRSEDSLHDEGRAVDVSTSDRDHGKYGMLARFAVGAGFDWVHYESKFHVHCSVKADKLMPLKTSGCFPGKASVRLESGVQKALQDLAIGERVLTLDSDGRPIYSPLIMFLDFQRWTTPLYYSIQAGEPRRELECTGAHLVHTAVDPIHQLLPTFANRIREGHYVRVFNNNGTSSIARVHSVRQVERAGAVAPLLAEGTIVVSDVLASCYSLIKDDNIAHWAFAPLRLVHRLSESLVPMDQRSNVTEQPSGVHWYARLLHRLATVVPSDPLRLFDGSEDSNVTPA